MLPQDTTCQGDMHSATGLRDTTHLSKPDSQWVSQDVIARAEGQILAGVRHRMKGFNQTTSVAKSKASLAGHKQSEHATPCRREAEGNTKPIFQQFQNFSGL